LRFTDPRASRLAPRRASTVGTTREHERFIYNGNKANCGLSTTTPKVRRVARRQVCARWMRRH
jgi:hypothetical protein